MSKKDTSDQSRSQDSFRVTVSEKRCYVCGEVKPAIAFAKSGKSKSVDGLSSRCRVCNKQYMKDYYQKNRGRWKNYRGDNRDKINAAKRKLYRESEKVRRYYIDLANRWRIKNPERKYAQVLWDNYKLTLEEYRQILDRQNGGCALCGKKEGKINGKRILHVDHDHETGKVRGILCVQCNHGLGKFQDSVEILDKATAYLRRHKGGME